jgi:bifunctional polynucleotide phosphatase/kinase
MGAAHFWISRCSGCARKMNAFVFVEDIAPSKMAPTVIKLLAPRFRKKIAAFDFDHTLVMPKEGRRFPKNAEDYMWLTPNVPEVVKSYYAKKYMIVVFTNQSKPWKADQIKAAMSELEIPVTIVIAFDKADYKPNPILFETVVGEKECNKKASFFVGDALGRKGDWSDSDAKFAEAIGIKALSPEETFAVPLANAAVPKPSSIQPSPHQEIVILTGYPGSGKSTIAESLAAAPSGSTASRASRYVIISGDTLKTSKKMVKAAETPVKNGNSIIFDATNPTKERRAEFIAFAHKHKLPVRCVWVATSMDESYQRNMARPEDTRVPRIVYNVYKKHFQEPTSDEGCELVTTRD